MNAQVRVPFTQRTSQYTPTKKIYNIKGDFTMIGNTNLTLVNYGDDNGNENTMRYVDIDSDTSTWNSSSSTLNFSDENGANPACSKIVYAGLYWTGRASNGADSPNIFTAQRQNGTTTNNIDQNVLNNQTVTGTSYSLAITRNNISSTNRSPIYTFTSGTNSYVFRYTNSTGADRVTLSINGGTVNNIPVTVATSGTTATATLTTPYTIVDGTSTIIVKSLVRSTATNLSEANIQSTSSVNITITGVIPVYETRTYDKRKIKIKGPTASAYTELTAGTNDIYYPTTSDGFMYSAYTEITDYVINNGILGNYTVADVGLTEGAGGGTGFYGGWGIIVVYENSIMKYRDVTIFDGHSYVAGSVTTSFEIPIAGFNTVQAGPVNMKLGLMSGEGDRTIAGDYFQVRDHIDANWITLNHTGNSANNFFNSSIQTGGNARNPNLLNNTGLDISMFNIPNSGNSVVTNSQTSTKFRYGTTQDTFVIFVAAMAVDAYIPDVEAVIAATNINGVPIVTPTVTTAPGDIVDVKVDIKNLGTEAVLNSRFVVPIPYTASFVPGSLSKNIYFTPNPTPNNYFFDPLLGPNGSIVWDFGTLPLPVNPATILADFRFQIKVTEDCSILKNATCSQNVPLLGQISGTGAITGINFVDKPFYIGYNTSGVCVGQPILNPLNLGINAAAYVALNCQSTPDIREFVFCNYSGTTIPITSISGGFPPGTLFYNQYPITGATTQYTITNPFPATNGNTTYYGVPPGAAVGCYFEFIIRVTAITALPTASNVEYCQGAVASPLTATPNNPNSTLYYYTSLTGSALLSITPSTATVGQTTYYVSEAASSTCFSPKVPIVVTITASPSITINSPITIQGCNTNAITSLAYSETAVTITSSQFIAYGGSISNLNNLNFTLSYIDTKSGTCPIVVTRKFTISSSCGNQMITQIINITDTTNPTASNPTAITLQGCNGTFPAANVNVVTNEADNCSTPIVAFVSDSAPNVVGCTETIIRTYSVTDACLNTINVTQNLIRTVDTTNPTASNPTAITLQGCNVNFPQPNVNVVTNEADNCSTPIVAFVSDSAPNVVGCTETIIRTYSVTDACLNTINVTQNLIRTVDTTNPTASNPTAITLQGCNGTFPQPNVNVVTNEADICSTPVVAFVSDSAPNVVGCTETIIRTYSVTDACLNTINVTQNLIRTVDTTNPTASNPTAITLQGCNGTFPTPNVNVVTNEADNCSTPIVAFVSDSAPTLQGCTQTIIRTYSVTDACLNTINVTQNLIRTVDTTNPTALALTDITLEGCNGVFPEPNVELVSASDNCSTPTVAFVSDSTPTVVGCTETIIRTYSVTDACQNTISVTQNLIRTVDTTNPTAVSLTDINVIGCNVAFPAADISIVTASDNCSTPTVAFVSDSTPTLVGCTETIIRTYSVTDACLNTINVTQNLIRIVDTTNPAAVGLTDINVIGCNGTFPIADSSIVTASDNCSTPTVAFVSDSSPTINGCTETIIRTYSVTDACGNTIIITQNLIRTADTTNPTAVALSDINVIGCNGTFPAADSNIVTASDNCSTPVVAFVSDSAPTVVGCTETIVRTYSVTDACGNFINLTQNLIRTADTVPPVATPFDIIVNVNCDQIPLVPELQFSDNCSASSSLVSGFTSSITTPVNGSYTIVRTWIVNDNCNNQAVFTQTINVTIPNAITTYSVLRDCNIDNASDLQVNLDSVAGIIGGVWVDDNSSGGLTGNIFHPYLIPVGVYTFSYQINDPSCPRTIKIEITVDDECIREPCKSLNFFNLVTPNGDELNDNFVIENLDNFTCYPENTVEIFNRWGVMVYDTVNYDNKYNAFHGQSEGRSTIKKVVDLPSGTYFYFLTYKTSEGNYISKNGYLLLVK